MVLQRTAGRPRWQPGNVSSSPLCRVSCRDRPGDHCWSLPRRPSAGIANWCGGNGQPSGGAVQWAGGRFQLTFEISSSGSPPRTHLGLPSDPR
jgi:hypothetical protein